MSGLTLVYRAVTAALEPWAPVLLRWRAPEEAEELRAERLGGGAIAPAAVWWHAASLGEVAALAPVLAEARRRGGLVHAVTTTSRAGREAARRLDPGAALAPLDLPGAVRRALAARRPRSLVLVETEIWPNLLAEARRRGVRLAMVNARVSDRAWPRYRRIRGAIAPGIAAMDAIAARSERDAERLLALGARPDRISVAGNTKLDGPPPPPPLPLPWGPDPPLFVAASAHPGEIDTILDAFVRLHEEISDLRLVAAPRHLEPAIVARWAEEAARRGLSAARRSASGPADGAAAVLVLDTHGELRAALAAARVAVLGGTFVPVGGHNPMEAAAAGVPQVFGPYTGNAAEECDSLLAAGGALRAADGIGLAAALRVWLRDGDARAAASAVARGMAEESRGAAARAVAWLELHGVLPPPGVASTGEESGHA